MIEDLPFWERLRWWLYEHTPLVMLRGTRDELRRAEDAAYGFAEALHRLADTMEEDPENHAKLRGIVYEALYL